MRASSVCFYFALYWCLLLSNTHAQNTKKPNIVFLLMDDLGWANVGFHRPSPQNEEIQTPNMDFLIANGLQLTRHYAHYVCSPTRSSVQSGRLPVHCNLSNNAAKANIYNGIPPNYTCIAEHLQSNGNYSTHFVGKWDAGSTVAQQIPFHRGYDTAFGYLNHMNDYWTEVGDEFGDQCGPDRSIHITDLWENDRPAIDHNNTIYEEFQFAQRIYNHIDECSDAYLANNDKTFFIFYAAHIAHSPVQIPKQYLSQFENDENMCQYYQYNGQTHNAVYRGFNVSSENWYCRSIYQSMVNLMDEIIGNVTAHLMANQEVWDNTLIVFSSDNGGEVNLNETSANNYPLRGAKFVPFEGGIRMNAFVSGGYLPASRRGMTESGMMHITDWYATLCYLAGVDPTDTRAANAGLPPIDSLNVWPLISGRNLTSPRTEIAVDRHTLIANNYKLIVNTSLNLAGWSGVLFPNSSSPASPIESVRLDCVASNGCLFDVVNDVSEYHNVIQEHPQIAQSMYARLVELRKRFYSNDEHGTSLCPPNITMICQCWAAINIYGGFWGPSQTQTLNPQFIGVN